MNRREPQPQFDSPEGPRGGPLAPPTSIRNPRPSTSLSEPIRYSQRLEAIGVLAGGIAHELNSILQSLGNNLDFLRDAFEDLSSAAVHAAMHSEGPSGNEVDYLVAEIPRSLQGATKALAHATELVGALRETAVPSADRPRRLDINRGLKSAIAATRGQLRHVAQVHTQFALLPMIAWLGNDLHQVFVHLLINAAQAIEATHRPRLGTIRVWTELGDHNLQIGFEDDGCGISPEIQAQIFEPFFTTKTPGPGTGQGLALAQTVIEGCGGWISVDSREGRGTTIILHIPKNPMFNRPMSGAGGPR